MELGEKRRSSLSTLPVSHLDKSESRERPESNISHIRGTVVTPVRGPRGQRHGQRARLTERIFSFGDAPLRRYPVYTKSHL